MKERFSYEMKKKMYLISLQPLINKTRNLEMSFQILFAVIGTSISILIVLPGGIPFQSSQQCNQFVSDK